MARLFGTDGVRGLANRDLTAELAVDLSVAAAHVLVRLGAFAGHRPRAVVGRDSRASGEFLEAAVVAGLASAGVDVVASRRPPDTRQSRYLTARSGPTLASCCRRRTIRCQTTASSSSRGADTSLPTPSRTPSSRDCGEPWDRPDRRMRLDASPTDGQVPTQYVEHLVGLDPDSGSDGVRVVVDCANGAASYCWPRSIRTCRRRRHRHPRPARRAEHQRRLWLHTS